jgi:hypothetical protein
MLRSSSKNHNLVRRCQAVILLLILLVQIVAVTVSKVSAQAGLPTWPSNPNWQALVPGSSNTNVKAVSVRETAGSVTNANALITSGTATLSGTGATILLDFGKEVGGNPYITVSSGSGTINIYTSEAYSWGKSGSTYKNDHGSALTLSVNGANTYNGGLRGGFRFMAIRLATSGTVNLTAAGVTFRAYPAGPAQYQGWFMSNDNQLNSMWYAGAYTAHMDMIPAGVASCFSVPVIFDGAKRDRAIWSGDLIVSDPAAWLSVGTNSAPYIRGSVNAFLNLQQSGGRLHSAVGFQGCGGFNYAVTYSAYAAIAAIQYYRYSGDTAWITPHLTRLRNATAYSASRLNANGLIVTNDNDYWQTSQSGEVTEYSMVYYELLQNMIWLEGRIGSQANVTTYTNQATALRNAINSRLLASSGRYVRSNTDTARFPLDGNMNAIRLGVAPAGNVAGILTYFRDRWVANGSQITQPSPSMTDPYGNTLEPLPQTWEMMARMVAEDDDGALELMRRAWGPQVNTNSGYYTGTLWEFVGSNGLPTGTGFTSLAHAWGAGPTQVLTEYVLGVTPINEGYSTFQVKPQRGNLTWAQGQVPTGNGSIIVRWAADTAGQFHMEVVVPSGKSGQVWVPIDSSSATTAVMSGSATFVQRSGLYDIYQVGAGTVEFSSVPTGGGPTPTNTNTPTATRTPTITNTPGGTTNTPTPTASGINWTLCASENGTCTFTGTMTVRYGAGTSWFYRVATNSIACNNATFGDPINGTAKSCYYSPNGPTPTPNGPTNTPTRTSTPSGPTNTFTPTPTGINWTLCAQENGTCTFTGTMTVRYGAGTSWFYRVATNSIACNNATFGDPINGTAKACYYSPNGPTPTP